MGLMRRAIAREESERAKAMEDVNRMTDRFASTLVIAASIIAAVRLCTGRHQQAFATVDSSHRRWRGTGQEDTGKSGALNIELILAPLHRPDKVHIFALRVNIRSIWGA